MRHWDVAGDGRPWKVELDVRDLGGHLDLTCRARAGTLSNRVKEATQGGYQLLVGLPLGFQVKLGLVRGKFLPAGLHAVEASHVSISSLSSFRAAIGRAVWSSRMPMTGTPVLLNLLDGLVGVDPAYHVIWARLFGRSGCSKLIVSVSFGSTALFKWKGKSCPDGDASSCYLGHGDILVMDGQCQDELIHRDGPWLGTGSD